MVRDVYRRYGALIDCPQIYVDRYRPPAQLHAESIIICFPRRTVGTIECRIMLINYAQESILQVGRSFSRAKALRRAEEAHRGSPFTTGGRCWKDTITTVRLLVH